jgi:phosphopantetheinyl transferase
MASLIAAKNFIIYYSICDLKNYDANLAAKVYYCLNREEINYLNKFNNTSRKIQSQIGILELKMLGYKFSKQRIENISILHDKNNRPWIKIGQDINRRIYPVSVAHSGNLVLCALINKNIPTFYSIGVDIEKVCDERKLAIAKYFSYNEIKCINQASGIEKCNLFTRFWTKKESLIKTNLINLKDTLNLDLTKSDTIFIYKPYGYYECNFINLTLERTNYVACIAIATELTQK